MNFIKHNLFYVALLAITLVAGGVLITMGYLVSDDIETTKVAGRTQMLEKIKSFNSPTNKNVIDAKQERQTQLKARVDAVVQEGVKLNSEGLKVLEYPAAGGAPIPVFPFNPDVNKTYSYKVTQAYGNILIAKRAALRPTTQAGKDEIEAEAIEQAKIQKNKEGDIGVPAPAGGSAVPAAAPAPARDVRGLGPMGIPGQGVPGVGNPGVGNPGVGTPGDQAAKDAANIVRVRKAQMGPIYIPENALQNKFEKAKGDTDAKELWEAQLALWVQDSILTAIDKTINPDKVPTQTVIASPIKLLEKIEVNPVYVTGSKAVGDTGTGVVPHTPVGPGGDMGGVPRTPIGPGGDMGGFPRTPMGPGGVPAAADSTITVPAGDAVTNRVCTKDYDVIRYSFVVVMSPRYLPVLRSNIEKLNFHTILNVEQTDIQNDAAYANYYWGTEPVMKVKIDGEMLLLTAWERGSWETDKATGKKVVKSPPLMPLDVLKALPEDVKREDDKTRTTEDGKPAANAGPAAPAFPGKTP